MQHRDILPKFKTSLESLIASHRELTLRVLDKFENDGNDDQDTHTADLQRLNVGEPLDDIRKHRDIFAL
jgi:hypothetical protein